MSNYTWSYSYPEQSEGDAFRRLVKQVAANAKRKKQKPLDDLNDFLDKKHGRRNLRKLK